MFFKYGVLFSFSLLMLACSGKREKIPYEQIIVGSLELRHIKEKWGSKMFRGKLPVIIEINDVVTKGYNIKISGYAAEFLTKEEISRQSIEVYVKFTSIVRNGDEIRAEYEFPVLGAFAGAIFTDKGEGVWTPDWIKTGYY